MAVKLPGVAQSLPVAQGSGIMVRAPADPTGRALQQFGQQIAGAGNEITQAFEQEQTRVNQVRAEDAFTELRNAQIDLTVGEKNGFKNLRSGDAVKRPLLSEWSSRLDASINDIAAKLENTEQKEAFRRRADVAKSQFSQDILQHLSSENQVYQTQVMDSTVEAERNAASMHWNNPGDVLASMERVKKAVNSYADANGLPEEVRQQAYVKRASSVHAAIVGQAMDSGNPEYAELWFKTHREEIDAGTAERIQKVINENGVRIKAQKATDSIMERGLSASEAKKFVRQNHTGKERDEIMRRVEDRYADVAAEQRAQLAAAEDSAWKVAVQPNASLDDIPPSLWSSMSGESQKQITSYFTAKQKREKKEDDWAVLDQVEAAITTGDITGTEQLARYEPFLRDSTLRTLRKNIQKRGEISPSIVRRSFEDRVGKTKSKWNKSEREQWVAYQGYILDNVKETKRPEDVDVWADKWFMEGYGSENRLLINDPDTYGEAYTMGREDFLVRAPEEAQEEIGAALEHIRSAGVEVPKTSAAADEFYTEHYLEGSRWFNARDLAVTPQRLAAFALLKSQNKPVTEANINFVSEQLK